MLRISLAALALLASAPLAAPAQAEEQGTPNWWMVYDRDAPTEALLVDLNSFQNTDIGMVAQTMTVYENGKAKREPRTIDCMQPRIDGDLGAFVCGSQRYRAQHGESVTDPTPANVVALIPHNDGAKG